MRNNSKIGIVQFHSSGRDCKQTFYLLFTNRHHTFFFFLKRRNKSSHMHFGLSPDLTVQAGKEAPQSGLRCQPYPQPFSCGQQNPFQWSLGLNLSSLRWEARASLKPSTGEYFFKRAFSIAFYLVSHTSSVTPEKLCWSEVYLSVSGLLKLPLFSARKFRFLARDAHMQRKGLLTQRTSRGLNTSHSCSFFKRMN